MEINNKAQKKSFKLKWFHKFENLINNSKKIEIWNILQTTNYSKKEKKK